MPEPDSFSLSYNEEDQSHDGDGITGSTLNGTGTTVHEGGVTGGKTGTEKYFEMARSMTRTRDRRSRSNSTEQREPLVVYSSLHTVDD